MVSHGVTKLASALALASFASTASADGWACRNADLEISCSDGTCMAAEAHTPMDVHLTDLAMSVCAYSGCWEGAPAAVIRAGGFVTWVGAGLAFSTNPDGRADVSVTVETASGVATILVAGLYATPATCAAR